MEISAAKGALRLLYEQRDMMEDEVDEQLREEADDVEGIAQGNPEIIRKANFEVQDEPAAKPAPGKVENLATTTGDNDGELEAQFKPQHDVADDYEVEWATATDGPWQKFEVVRVSKVTLTGLPSGAKVFVRVRARNATGRGPWSDIACARVP
jgi:hypothetical protein